MPTFKELIRDKKVAQHPLLKGYRDLSKVRDNINKHAQALGEELTDVLSKGYQPEEKPKNLPEMVREASRIVQDVFFQFDIPVLPKFFYETSRDLRHARNDENRIVEGSLIFGAEFRSTLGVRKRATIAVPISAGELIPPSVMEMDNRIYVIAQASIDEILDRNQTYYNEPLRESYQSPPLNRFEREMAVEMKVSQGPQPRKNPREYYMNQRNVEARRKVAVGGTPRQWEQVVEAMEKAEEDGKDTFPRSWIHVLRNYILDFVATASKDAWEPHLINAGFCINPYGKATNRGRGRKAQSIQGDFEKEIELEVDEAGVEQLLDDEPEAPAKEPRMYPETKTPIENGDGVKVKKGPGGGQGFQGTIVEIDEEGDYLIIKSKGMEYRVTVDDIEPVPSTFKKMYM